MIPRKLHRSILVWVVIFFNNQSGYFEWLIFSPPLAHRTATAGCSLQRAASPGGQRVPTVKYGEEAVKQSSKQQKVGI